MESALKAARLDRTNEDSLYCIREARATGPSSSKGWNLVVLCEREGRQAYTSYSVKATSVEQALELCRELEPTDLKLLEIDSAEEIETDAEAPDGVYGRTGLAFFESP